MSTEAATLQALMWMTSGATQSMQDVMAREGRMMEAGHLGPTPDSSNSDIFIAKVKILPMVKQGRRSKLEILTDFSVQLEKSQNSF